MIGIKVPCGYCLQDRKRVWYPCCPEFKAFVDGVEAKRLGEQRIQDEVLGRYGLDARYSRVLTAADVTAVLLQLERKGISDVIEKQKTEISTGGGPCEYCWGANVCVCRSYR